MGEMFMSCGHKAIGDEWEQGWYWKEWDGDISYGSLCDKCVPVYRAVQARDFEEAQQLLKDDPGVTLQDICASWEGTIRRTEKIDGIDWDIVEIPPRGGE